MNIGLVGCGRISKSYLDNAKRLGLNFVAVSDLVVERAQAVSREYGIPKALTTEQLIADKDVQAVLNLTIPQAHFPIAMAALETGKHVYSEKPLSVTRDEGLKLIATAKSKGLRIGNAPDTFFGTGLQISRKLLDEGAIGEPTSVEIYFYCGAPEDPTSFFLQAGGGILMDMGPYYFTALVHLLGPVKRLAASTKTIPTAKMLAKNRAAALAIPVPTTITGVLDLDIGITASVNLSYNVCEYYLPHIHIHGTEGTLVVPDPNSFGGSVIVKSFGEEKRKIVAAGPFADNSRGVGLADMLEAIPAGRPHRASGELSLHVLDIMYSMTESSSTGKFINLATTATRPEPFLPALPPDEPASEPKIAE
jgi:predicted dehydrogenase